MIEFPDVAERRQALGRLVGVEDRVWMAVERFDRVYAIADEDLERETEEKTSSVHFLRFELEPGLVAALKDGAALSAGADQPALEVSVSPVPGPLRESLRGDLD
jgi:hypothetical protein